MVSDQEIAKAVELLLSQSDPKSFTTLTDVVRQLGHKLGFDLSHKAIFIRDQINLLFRSQSNYHQPPPPPPPPPPSQLPVTSGGIDKDHFALQHQQYAQFHFSQQQAHAPSPLPQFQHPHFSFQHQQHRQQHPLELNFSNPSASLQTAVPPPPPQQSQLQALPEVKTEGGVSIRNTVGISSEKPKKGGSAGNKRRGGPGGLNKLCGISPELQVIVGESALSRTDIVKLLWAYIKKNNLQDPGNKRKIICDDALRIVFETDSTDMFKMNKLLAKHIIRLEPTKESSRKRSKVNVEPAAITTDIVEPAAITTDIVEPAAVTTDIVPCQVIISEALANCLGTEEREMSQSEALRLVWEYIKVNNLEDPQNPVMIICDTKLREVFGCESISMVGVPELLVGRHLFKQ